ncbi:type II secretion system F family protein [Microbacterium sp. STN6]|uniref:type II secretion system F family protein n=1 Tax=Microbacterium sp. STN6 TaxID=2995588 RepID=UPI002260D606|nr:type II secretion system F family protein [Microbacterium sp. STN6]MCX7522000.1 type II secretion system F family protein [Microbacterium sp. STN6]
MSQAEAWGVVCGLAMGLGLWAVVGALPRFSRPRLADRVAPYIVDVSDAAVARLARTRAEPLPVIGGLLGPLATTLRRAVSDLVGGNESIQRRLRQAGLERTVDQFRGRQLLWAVGGLGAGILAVVAVGAVRVLPPLVQVAVPLVAALCAFILADWLLKRAAVRRVARLAEEFPTVVEFLSLCLAAGEGILDAVARVSRASSGELTRELGAVVREVRTGVPLANALRSLADRAGLPMLTRFVEAVVAALDHGSPLAEVLRAQAQDSREDAKRQLLELAGRKEVAMMVPLVFLILPVTVLFAIYPGIFVLQSGL